MKRLSLIVAAGALFAPLSVDAQVARDAAERRVDRVQLAGDVSDVRRLERLVNELDQARAAKNPQQERAVQIRISAMLKGEAAEARRDARQDARETGVARREVRRDRATGTARGDDRRDLRDDRRDAAAAAGRARREQDIMAELRQIQPSVNGADQASINRQRALLDEFLKVAREDAKATGRELGEDRRETREDIRRP